MHERIDRTESLSDQDKERLHQTVDTANTEMDKVREASARLDRLRAEELAAKDDPARKAEIETETKRELDRLETGRASLTDLRRNLESEIESSESLTREQKTEINTILREFAEGRITQREAESQLGESRILQNEAFYLLIALVTIGVIHFVIESNRGGG